MEDWANGTDVVAGASAVVQDSLRGAALPNVRMFEGAREFFVGQHGEVHALGMRRNFNARFIAGINDAPDAAMRAVNALWIGVGVLVARIFVVPIHNPNAAVGTNLRGDGAEPAVVGAD